MFMEYFEFFGECTREGLTSVLRISIHNGESETT